MNDFDPFPERIEGLRRAEQLSRKINLLLDATRTASGQPYKYAEIRDGALEAGYYISRTRWSLLKQGREQVIPEEALHAIAQVFDVNPDFLLKEDGNLPRQVEDNLEQVRNKRRAEVRNFAARVLGPVDAEAVRAIAGILDRDAKPAPTVSNVLL